MIKQKNPGAKLQMPGDIDPNDIEPNLPEGFHKEEFLRGRVFTGNDNVFGRVLEEETMTMKNIGNGLLRRMRYSNIFKSSKFLEKDN